MSFEWDVRHGTNKQALDFLFVWSLSSHSIIFHSFRDVTNAGKGLQILTFARHSWPLSSEGSLSVTPSMTLYNDHVRGPLPLTPIAKSLAVKLSLPVLTT